MPDQPAPQPQSVPGQPSLGQPSPGQSSRSEPGPPSPGLPSPGHLVFAGDDRGGLPPARAVRGELWGCCPDPDAGPPDGEDAWLADLTAAQLDALA